MIVQSVTLQRRSQGTVPAKATKTQPRTTTLPPISKPSPTKQKVKRETGKKVNQKPTKLPLPVKEKVKSNREIATELLSEPERKDTSNCGQVVVRYNHYHKSFPIHNGVLKWEDIDKEYFISFAFPGNFIRKIFALPSLVEGENIYRRNAGLLSQSVSHGSERNNPLLELQHDEKYDYFLGLVLSSEYLLRVEEDPLMTQASSPVKFVEQDKCPLKSGNRAVQLLTSELKSIKPTALDSDEAKDLIERRDLEDLLFSSP